LRITFLLTQSLESPSGLGRYWPLSKELVRLGHEVTLLALHHNFQTLQQQEYVEGGVRVHYVGQMHVRKVGNQKLYFGPIQLILVSTLATLRLTKAALLTPTDVYHICKPHPMNGLALLPPLLLGKPVYLDCDDYEAASNRFSGSWQRRIVAFFENSLPRITAGVTVNTRFMAERLVQLGCQRDRIVYVPNGVDRTRFSAIKDVDIERARRRLGLEDRKVIVYVGSLSLANHAVDLLLEAFALVQRAEGRAILILVGGGEDYEKLQRQAQALGLRRVLFLGRVPPDEVPLYYRLAEVSVDPVRGTLAEHGRYPLKVVESLAAGTPVITGDVGDRATILAHGGGLLIPPGDPVALSEAMIALLRDEPLRDRLSAEALAIRERFYWDRLVHDFTRIYGYERA